MFIRYNQTAKYWEYDTSVSQDGTGPWIILPIDKSQIYNQPALPSNIAFKDQKNIFTKNQEIQAEVAGQWASLWLHDSFNPVDQRRWRVTNAANNLYFQSLKDAGTDAAPGPEDGHVNITRQGALSATGAGNFNGSITALSGFITGPNHQLIFKAPDDPADKKQYRFMGYSNGNFYFELLNDAGSVFSQPWACTPSGDMFFGGPNGIYASGHIFPSVQASLGNGNALDDYEEGTWAPTLVSDAGGGGTAYAAQYGSYTKIGNLVRCNFYFNITSANWSTGYVNLSGFPFITEGSASNWGGGISLGYWNNPSFDAFSNPYTFLIVPGSSSAILYGKNAGGTSIGGGMPVGAIGSGTDFRGSFTYRTNT